MTTALDLSQCVGYAKTKKRRCGVQLQEDQAAGRWLDPQTGAHGGELDGPPRCTYHPADTDPDDWTPGADPAPDPDPPARLGPDRQLSAGPIPHDTPDPDPPATDDLPELDGIPEPGPGSGPDEPAPDLDQLDQLAAELIGEGPERDGGDPQDPAGPPPGPGGPEAAPGPGDTPAEPEPEVWSRDEIAAMLAWLNPPLERMGADPVPDAELQEGAKLLQPGLNRLLNRIPPERWLPLIWATKTYAPRVLQAGQARAQEQAPEGAPETNGAGPARPTPVADNGAVPSSWTE